MGDVPVSVVLPCLNEAETVATCVSKALNSLAQLGLSGEVIVADNGSIDGSQELARAAGARVVEVELKGYGAALQAGFASATGEYVIMADADDSYALDDLGPFIRALDSGADLVIGNRFEGGIDDGAMPWLHRYVGNPLLSLVGRTLFRTDVRDFHCGMRGFRKSAVLPLGLHSSGMEFASEMIIKSSVGGLAISEVPTQLHKDGRSRPPHLRTWRDGWRHLRFLLLLSPRWLLVYPGLVLSLLGILGVLWLLPGPRQVGDLSLQLQSMLVFAAVGIIGTQLLVFGIIARVFASSLGLLPDSGRMVGAKRVFTLEKGLLVGLLVFVVGLALLIARFVTWASSGFGPQSVDESLRLAILGMQLAVMGMQVFFGSFVVSLSGVPILRNELPPARSEE